MRNLVVGWLMLSVTLAVGCASFSESARMASNGIKNATEPMRQSWRRVVEPKKELKIVDWKWTLGIPVDVPRGELLAATIPNEALAHFLPHLDQGKIQLASAGHQVSGFEIRNMAGQEINNCSDLHLALEQLPDSERYVQVDLAQVGAQSDAPETAVRVDRPTLMALGHAIAQQTQSFRVSEEGNPTLVIRDGGIRGHIVARLEQKLGLVQLVITTSNCWDGEVLLPVEVRTSCNGQPLQCLTVADALELLYGEPNRLMTKPSISFAETSEREDYLLPVNYNRLSGLVPETRGLMSPKPAFATLIGTSYPGPALLGDARALTGIMLERQLLKKGEQSKTGWLLFTGDEARTADHVDVSIDLGSGLKTYSFMIPAAS